jgi:hypothetical protein
MLDFLYKKYYDFDKDKFVKGDKYMADTTIGGSGGGAGMSMPVSSGGGGTDGARAGIEKTGGGISTPTDSTASGQKLGPKESDSKKIDTKDSVEKSDEAKEGVKGENEQQDPETQQFSQMLSQFTQLSLSEKIASVNDYKQGNFDGANAHQIQSDMYNEQKEQVEKQMKMQKDLKDVQESQGKAQNKAVGKWDQFMQIQE